MKRHFLILTQTYPPDFTAVGRHIADAAEELVRRGHVVNVFTSSRSYENPKVVYPKFEVIHGVNVVRLPLSSFGKKSFSRRLLAAIFFMVMSLARGIFLRHVDCIVVSTVPPLCGVAALILSRLKQVPLKYWVMDLNPDQLIALSKIKESSLAAAVLTLLNKAVINYSQDIIVLDRFMEKRLALQTNSKKNFTIIPPWPHEDYSQLIDKNNAFRKEFNLEDKFIFMYSGNHGTVHPVDVFIAAATKLVHNSKIHFVFIGDGVKKKDVEQAIKDGLTNILSLPYQPVEKMRYSLSAADVHLVAVQANMVGILHPSKVYTALTVGRPFLFVGPSPSYVSDLLAHHDVGWQLTEEDPDKFIALIAQIISLNKNALQTMQNNAKELAKSVYNKEQLCGKFCDVLMN